MLKSVGAKICGKTFYTGDFLVLPTGFTGKWESKGHRLFRSLRVYKAATK